MGAQPQAAAIFHITTRALWEQSQKAGSYRGDTLDSEGFIHCSLARQVVAVANAVFQGQDGLVLLLIDVARVSPEIKYEGAGNDRFPHIYGALNIDAVIKVYDIPPDEHGRFHLPEEEQV